MRIVVLGGSGFVGSALAPALQKFGHHVVSLSRQSGLNVLDFQPLLKRLKELQPDAIYNCAARFGSLRYLKRFEADIFYENNQMILNIYRAIAEACPTVRIINPLSNCSYPGNTSIQKESEWLMGEVHESVFSYGNTRRLTYVVARCYETQYGIKSINLLVPNVFGPGDHTDVERVHALNGIIIRMIKAHRNNDPKFEIWGTGTPVREWLYIDDLVAILEKSLTIQSNLVHPVNIAQNRGYSIRDSAGMVAEALGFSGDLVFNTAYPDGDPKKVLDDETFRSTFGDVTFTDHMHGIRKTVEYYQTLV